jgi:pilus assembly protein CpaE
VTAPFKTLVAVDNDVDLEELQAALPPEHEVQLVGVVEGLEESWKTLQETATDLLVIACAGYSDRVLFLIEGAVRERPERPVVVLCAAPQNGFVRRVFEAGADDFVTLADGPEQVAFALQKAIARKQGVAIATGMAVSPMICVLGPKGGTGKTVTTCNLAVSLAMSGQKVVIVDLDLQFGDVGLSLGLQPEKTVYDLAKSGGSLDAEKIDGYLATHHSGVRALLAPTRPDQASVVSVEFLREVYALLRSTYDYLIVDTPPGFTAEVIASIDSSSEVCVVGTLDSLSLKNTKLGLETLELMGYNPERIRLVLNRAGTRVGITAEDVASIMGRAPDIFVPSDRDIPRSVNEGDPIVLAKQRSESARAFRQLAESYRVRVADPKKNGRASRRRLFARRR